MLDDLFEMALELLLEGAVEGAKSKKVPLPVRVLLAAGLGGLVLGLCGWAFWRGLESGDYLFCAVMAAAVGLFASGGWAAFRRWKNAGQKSLYKGTEIGYNGVRKGKRQLERNDTDDDPIRPRRDGRQL